MEKSNIIKYQGKQINRDVLKKIACQGCLIAINSQELTVVNSEAHTEVVVVARGQDAYDVLLGVPREGRQRVRLVSKIVLKKAQVDDAVVMGGGNQSTNYRSYQYEPQRERYNTPRTKPNGWSDR